MKVTILHGPQASGKTRYKDRIAKVFNCNRIVELDDEGAKGIRAGDLVITNTHPDELPPSLVAGARIVEIRDALKRIGVTTP